MRGQPPFLSLAGCRGYLFGHWQPLEQSLQQSHVQLQFGQSLQQSFVQQVPVLQIAASSTTGVDCPVAAAATTPAAITKPPNNLTNIENSLS
jgi:hypothetical protein